MRINSLKLRNYRRYVDFEIEFPSRFAVIIGVNGSGKTSLLSAIADALTPVISKIGVSWSLPLANDENVRQERVILGGQARFERRFPVEIIAEGRTSQGQSFTWTVRRDQSPSHANFDQSCYALGSVIQEQINSSAPTSAAPLVAYYRANRQWQAAQLSTIQAATKRDSRVDAYSNWAFAAVDAPNLQLWLVSKYLERLQVSNDSGLKFDEIESDELAVANGVIAAVVEGARSFRFDMKDHALLIEWEGGSASLFSDLSDGQRSAICLVTDIARRLCLLNPQLGYDGLLNSPGIVLIDELDVHLHPSWQGMIVRGLKKAFPSLQFIVASHSPQILGELSPEEIVVLDSDGVAHPQVSYGMDASRVLEIIMGTPARPIEVQKAIDEIFEAIERNDLSSAWERLTELRKRAPGVTELGRADALIRRKEMLGQ